MNNQGKNITSFYSFILARNMPKRFAGR